MNGGITFERWDYVQRRSRRRNGNRQGPWCHGMPPCPGSLSTPLRLAGPIMGTATPAPYVRRVDGLAWSLHRGSQQGARSQLDRGHAEVRSSHTGRVEERDGGGGWGEVAIQSRTACRKDCRDAERGPILEFARIVCVITERILIVYFMQKLGPRRCKPTHSGKYATIPISSG